MDDTSRIDKARGVLFGLALGDCLGAPFEDKVGVTDAHIVAQENAGDPLTHTDDTALALVLSRHLAHRRGDAREPSDLVDLDQLATEFAAAWHAEPWRGYGGGVTKSFRLIVEGTPWRQAIRAVYPEGSFGNGGAMRVAPVALVGADVAQVAELARRSAEVTHAHEDALHGAVCQAVAVHAALALAPDEPVRAGDFVDTVRRAVPSPLWQDKLDHVIGLVERQAGPAEAAEVLGNDVSAPGSVPLALLSFLRNAGSPSDAVRFAIRAGGDTDTVASMAGALAGAHSGYAAWPRNAVSRLEAAAQLHLYAEHLA
ncbi:ADP-ribosylglycohydrolase family protein [Saccharomonospora sp. NB11]|uniref:ADP-ribosylglycohydrolase family protein n=1 Tax=Saccharomonospora sp. NB11 TaxID=1642298 RepID=UPI0018D17D10|nr:ADP-ribosylglycohydrolase family protein [Saccharomonospora sp. NB11]